VIEETERLLRDQRYLYDVQIRPLALQDGVVDIEVVTRDSWSLIPGVSAARAGGENSSGIRLREYNFLGTGTTLGISHSSNVDRSSNQLARGQRPPVRQPDRGEPEPGQEQRR
jgi:outer membrane protein assembly factor BamA